MLTQLKSTMIPLLATVAAFSQVSTFPPAQNVAVEFQGNLESADAGRMTFYLQAFRSQNPAGGSKASVIGVFGQAFAQRDYVITAIELRGSGLTYRPGLEPRLSVRQGTGTRFAGGGPLVGAITVLDALVADPSSVEVVVMTEDRPDGLLRGRLQRAAVHYFAAITEGSGARGYEVFLTSTTRTSEGEIDSAMIQAQLSSIRGVSLPAVRGVYPWRIAIAEGGTGTLHDFGSPSDEAASVPGFPDTAMFGLDMRDAGRRAMLERLLTAPRSFAARVGAGDVQLAGVMRKMDRAVFFPRLGGPADATAYLEADVLRDESGAVTSGILYNITDWSTGALRGGVRNVRLHAGGTAEEGPVLAELQSGQRSAPVGRFLIDAFPVIPEDGAGRAALDRMINYPDLVYLAAVTANEPNGLRAQVLSFPGLPEIAAVQPGTLAAGAGFASGGLITIFGRNLAKVTSGLDAWEGQRVPSALNGGLVEIGGQRAALLFVSPTQINAQIPFEVSGEVRLAVNHGTGPGGAVTIRVAPRSPSLFSAVDSGDGSVTVYGTGFGQAASALATGQLIPAAGDFRIAGVSATLGGQPAEVMEAAALPGLPGLYRVRVRTAGSPGVRPLAVRAGDAVSNTISVTVR